MTSSIPRAFRLLMMIALALPGGDGPAQAAFTQYDTETYDSEALGVPKFVDTNYIDLRKITQISKFRSSAGHDYSDSTQFNIQGLLLPTGLERCSSMKHYFIAPDDTVNIYAPTSGVVSRRFDEAVGGTQVQITSDVQPAFTFIIFHINLTSPLPEGTRVEAGQLLGHHIGTQTFSDIAVAVHTPRGYHLVSYFETLTDSAFAAFTARGVTSREQLIYTREQRAADRFSCAGTRFINLKTPADADYFTLTGGATKQTINAPPSFSFVQAVGDAPYTFSATATSGLPVTLTSNAPKVCAVNGLTVTWRRRGQCILTLSQAGTDDIFPAAEIRYQARVLAGPQTTDYPRLGGIFPPSPSGTRSLLRIFNGNLTGAGTVSIALLDGTSGQRVATWTSPSIAPGTGREFPISDLESAATAGFTRPAVYGLKVENPTFSGTLQHALFNLSTNTLTNASACHVGLLGNPERLVSVHSAVLAGAYPSTITFANATGTPGIFPQVEMRTTATGALVGSFSQESPDHSAIKPHAQISISATDFENRARYNPDPTTFHYTARGSNYLFPSAYVQHLVSNNAAGVIADMTTQCNLYSFDAYTVMSPLVVANVLSSTNAAAQSFLRFYNAGTAAAPAIVTLHDVTYGTVLGQWTSPDIPPGAELQYSIGKIEDEIGLAKQPTYTVSVDTTVDGAFQHVLWRAPAGALSNASTCAGSTTTEAATVLGVHASTLAAAGYPSTVIVNNTGTAAAVAKIGVYDAATGARLGGFSTTSIPPDAQVHFDSAALETRAQVPAGTTLHYVVKLEDGFSGFLQHYVSSSGVITDMTVMCGM